MMSFEFIKLSEFNLSDLESQIALPGDIKQWTIPPLWGSREKPSSLGGRVNC